MTAEPSALPAYGWFSELPADSPLKTKTQSLNFSRFVGA